MRQRSVREIHYQNRGLVMKVYKIKVNGKSYKVELEAIDEVASSTDKVAEVKKEEPKKVATPSDAREVLSPIQGTVTNVKVKPGDKVKKGDVLLIIEAMKLENEVPSPYDGEVVGVLVSKGQSVASKELVVTIR